jgi:hypothetical protein
MADESARSANAAVVHAIVEQIDIERQYAWDRLDRSTAPTTDIGPAATHSMKARDVESGRLLENLPCAGLDLDVTSRRVLVRITVEVIESLPPSRLLC